jgi:hypothetical protein
LEFQAHGPLSSDPAYAEVLVGEGNLLDGDVAETKADFAWGDVYETDERTAEIARGIAEGIGPEGPSLAGREGSIAAVGREVDAPVASHDGDLTHPEVKTVADVEEY